MAFSCLSLGDGLIIQAIGTGRMERKENHEIHGTHERKKEKDVLPGS
jgi:hypothetical protein